MYKGEVGRRSQRYLTASIEILMMTTLGADA